MVSSGLRPMNVGIIFTLLVSILLCAPAYAADTAKDREFRLAAGIGDTYTLSELLDQGVDVNSANQFGKTALMMAVETGSMETVALLLSRGADLNAETVAGCSALTFAAENGHIGISALLLERGADVHDRTRAGWDALMIASRSCGVKLNRPMVSHSVYGLLRAFS